jgi:hypothetical protein
VTTFPRIISHKTFISRFSLSDFDTGVGPFVLILDKILFFAAFYGSEYLLLAGVPGVARDDKWRNRIAILCIM